MTKCMRDGCNRTFPGGLSSVDGVCFPCREPKRWTEKDEASYQKTLDEARPKKQEKKSS